MKGKYTLNIVAPRVRFILEIDRQVTIIQGDSSTGKSYMIDLLRIYLENNNHEINVETDFKDMYVLRYDRFWKRNLSFLSNTLILIDEDFIRETKDELPRYIKNSDNYFLIVTRDSLKHLTYSVECIYRFENKQTKLVNKIFTTTYMVKEFKDKVTSIKDAVFIVEDSGIGFQFYSTLFPNKVISAKGNSGIEDLVRREDLRTNICTIVDGAAFGCYIQDLYNYIRVSRNSISLLMPESFEGVILKSKFFENKLDVNAIVNNTYDYCDSKDYLSWEQFYTDKLTYFMKKYYKLNYSKSSNSDCLELFLKSPRTILEAIDGFPLYLLEHYNSKEHNLKDLNSF